MAASVAGFKADLRQQLTKISFYII